MIDLVNGYFLADPSFSGRSLTNLDLWGNDITAIGARDIALALRHNISLRELNLRVNIIKKQEVLEFEGPLKDNFVLIDLALPLDLNPDMQSKMDRNKALKDLQEITFQPYSAQFFFFSQT